YGNNLAPSTKFANILPLNLSLAGVSATVNGIAAPLGFASSGQMNIQIPYETSVGTAVLGIDNNGAAAAFAFPVSPVAPGIFNTPLTGKPGQTIVAYISGEGDVTPTLATGNVPPAGTKLANFPQPRQPISITVDGEPANIAFAGIVSLVGVTQVNFTIPGDIAPGVHPVVVTVGGVASPPLNITVTAP
ncbi:MAG: peptidase S8, partial [Acidobacteriota bacterium]|nr:peptidase S8 [Acidobacteriota bacterium]